MIYLRSLPKCKKSIREKQKGGFAVTFLYTTIMEMQYSLSALLDILDRSFKAVVWGFDFWWRAEILKIQQKGKNVYAELVEYDEEGKIVAKVKGCIFQESIYAQFLRETKLRDVSEMTGLKVLFYGKFSFHKDYGISIIINELSAEYTLGHLQKKQEDILQKLQKLQIIYNNKYLSRTYPPYKIAIISAQDAAWLKDFYTIAAQSGYNIEYKEYLCAMHGNNAIAEVQEQLTTIMTDIKDGEQFSAVAIIRGGGESSGMAWQNDFEIAKMICLMPVPVIVAVGHTQDKTVLQDIAWYGAKTPTDAAYKLTELLEEWEENITVLYDSIITLSTEKLIRMRDNIDLWQWQIVRAAKGLLQHTRVQIDAWYHTIVASSPTKILQSGYALLMQQGAYLSKDNVQKLEPGDEIDIQVYDQIFSAKITKKN